MNWAPRRPQLRTRATWGPYYPTAGHQRVPPQQVSAQFALGLVQHFHQPGGDGLAGGGMGVGNRMLHQAHRGTRLKNNNTNNAFYNSAGITFDVNGSSAGTGRWALQSIQFEIGGTGGGVSLSGGRVSLWKNNGSGTYNFQGSQTLTGYTYSAGAGATTAATFTLAADNAFGTVGNLNSGLEAGNYLLGIDNLTFNSGTSADGYFVASNAASNTTGRWGPAVSYWGSESDGSGGFNFPANGSISTLGTSFSNNFYVQLNGAAVPEPGTLILGGIAAVSGGAGAWWRRRKNRKAAAEQAV